MGEIGAIVEGETEQAFVQHVLAPELSLRGVHMWARLPGRIYRRGGVRPWEVIRADICRTLKERADLFCTTMFDFYAMPKDWPGRVEASSLSWDRRGEHVQKALLADIVAHMGRNFFSQRFIPYVQIHEFEAVLLTDVDKLASVLTINPAAVTQLKEAVADAGAPEAVNDDPEKIPSRHISNLRAGYRKPIHGIIAAQRIGLSAMRVACPNLNCWLERLEGLNN